MKCVTYAIMMDDYLDETLAAGAREELECHLSMCAECRDKIRSLQSLLCLSAALPRTVKPDHDLWPGIAREIRIAGNPEKLPIRLRIAGRIRALPRTWRLAAASIACIVLMLAATRLMTRSPEMRSNSHPASVGTEKTVTPSSSQEEQEHRSPVAGKAPGGSPARVAVPQTYGNSDVVSRYSDVCRCEAPAETLDEIDQAFLVDENLPSSRASEVISERLFRLAGESNDNFFMLKASLEVLSMPSQVSEAVRNRYRKLMAQHPEDPGAVFMYAYSLFGKDTPAMIAMMQRLIDQNPDFPWPNLVLARVSGYPNLPAVSASRYSFNNPARVKAYLVAFMKLCPDSPAPTSLLAPLADSEFLADTVRRMRDLLATRRDTRSLLLYQDLWYLEGGRQATGEDFSEVRRRIMDDLKSLQSMEAGRPPEFRSVERSGYSHIGEMEAYRALLAKDTSYEAREGSIAHEMLEWNAKNPVPAADAAEVFKVAYWEKRLRANDSWIKKLPEATFLWLDRLKTMAELKNRSENEFTAVGEKILALIRGEAPSFNLDILKISALYVARGVRLDQVPALIKEGLDIAEKRYQQQKNDLSPSDLLWPRLRFSNEDQAEEVWYSLLEAYLRLKRPDKAREVLSKIESGLAAARRLLAQAQVSAWSGDSTAKTAIQRMNAAIPAREAKYAEALVRVGNAERK